MQKLIKDPVHGYIEIPDELIPLLDCPLLQRLHGIRQLGFTYLAYPGANHTRFEHSLGTMELANRVCRQLNLDMDESRIITAAALLHDIGHGPFSHISERLASFYGPFSHDDILPYKNELQPYFNELGTDIHEVADLISGHHSFSSILHGDLDVDRMDYLMRDAYYSGVPYGLLDTNRLIQSLDRNRDEEIYLKEGGIPVADSLLLARTKMTVAIYCHHVPRIADEMFLLAGIHELTSETIHEFLRYDDGCAMSYLMNAKSPICREIITRIRTRNLYKRSVYVGRNQVNINHEIMRSPEERERLKSEIAETAGIENHQVILDIPPLVCDIHMHMKIRSKHDYVPFEDMVPLFNLMNQIRKEQWRLGVYTPAEHVSRVYDAAMNVLGIHKLTTQKTLSSI